MGLGKRVRVFRRHASTVSQIGREREREREGERERTLECCVQGPKTAASHTNVSNRRGTVAKCALNRRAVVPKWELL